MVTLTFLIERVIAKSASLWTSPVHSEHISEWIWRSWSSLICMSLSKHPKELVERDRLKWTQAISYGPSSISSTFGQKSIPNQTN